MKNVHGDRSERVEEWSLEQVAAQWVALVANLLKDLRHREYNSELIQEMIAKDQSFFHVFEFVVMHMFPSSKSY